jgi:hypothetical protein
MAFWEDDLPIFFKDFAIDAEWMGKTIEAIFHNAYEAVTLFGSDIESKNPFIEVQDSDIQGIASGDTVTIDSVDYKVMGPPQPDGTGITLLMLSKD